MRGWKVDQILAWKPFCLIPSAPPKFLLIPGYLPKSNQLIDLAARVEKNDYIFEMKSITEENAKSQIRKGVSQLYEYRYLQNVPNARLVLAVEIQLPDNIEWMHDYLELDRDIMLVWDGDESLFSSSKTKNALNFLW